jgi:hypothetical protein
VLASETSRPINISMSLPFHPAGDWGAPHGNTPTSMLHMPGGLEHGFLRQF